MDKEFKQLRKENNKIRKKLEELLQEGFSTIDDNYVDIWDLIEELIGNEIEQESYCNK